MTNELITYFKHSLYTLLCAVYVNFKSLTRHAYAKFYFLMAHNTKIQAVLMACIECYQYVCLTAGKH